MSKKFYLMLLAVFVLAACDPSKKLTPEEQRELDRENREVWRQLGSD